MPNVQSVVRDAESNRFLKSALASLPEYGQAVELRAAAKHAQNELRTVGIAEPPATSVGIHDYLERVAEQVRDTAVVDAQRGALGSLIAQADSRIESLLATKHGTLLAYLQDDLDALIDDLDTAVLALAGAATAGEAIAGGAEDAWRRLPELRVAYDNLRAAQTTVVNAGFDPFLIVSAQSPSLSDPMASDLVLANLDDLLPGWRQPDDRRSMSTAPLADRQPWPSDPLEELVWLSTSGARPWIPTARQLSALHAERRTAGQQALDPDDTIRPHERRAPAFTALNTPATA